MTRGSQSCFGMILIVAAFSSGCGSLPIPSASYFLQHLDIEALIEKHFAMSPRPGESDFRFPPAEMENPLGGYSTFHGASVSSGSMLFGGEPGSLLEDAHHSYSYGPGYRFTQWSAECGRLRPKGSASAVLAGLRSELEARLLRYGMKIWSVEGAMQEASFPLYYREDYRYEDLVVAVRGRIEFRLTEEPGAGPESKTIQKTVPGASEPSAQVPAAARLSFQFEERVRVNEKQVNGRMMLNGTEVDEWPSAPWDA